MTDGSKGYSVEQVNNALDNYHKMAEITIPFNDQNIVEVSLRNYVGSSAKLINLYPMYTDSSYYEDFTYIVIDDTSNGGSVRLRCKKTSTTSRNFKIKIVYRT